MKKIKAEVLWTY